jgi:hypothetical protein
MERLFRDGVDVLVMLVGYYDNMPRIVDPPFWRNECGNVACLINNIAIPLIFGFMAGKSVAKRTNIISWLMR